MSEDDATIATNDDAAIAKRCAVRLGYWKDPYIEYFIRASERKAPEINRGYYARVKGMQTLLKKFLEATKGKGQVINLGAGYDSTYWNLKEEGYSCKAFVEVDFQTVTTRKTNCIQQRRALIEKLKEEEGDEIKANKTDLHASTYHIVGADLRNLADVQQKLAECGVDNSVPTLFQAECVLVYMPPEASAGLLRWITEHFCTAVFVNYEQVNMGDQFGKVMMDNLRSRGCTLHGVDHCRSMDSQKSRFLDTGWSWVDSMDMMSVYRILPQEDVQRFKFPLQLKELQRELFSHYSITWAVLDRDGIGLEGLKIDTVSIKEEHNGPSSSTG